MAICEQCGKEHDGSFGSGRFCCRSCSNKWVALHQSEEAKARKVAKGRENLRCDVWKGRKHSNESKKKISDSVREVMKNPEIRKKISDAGKGKVVSEETRKKLSISMHKAIDEGRHSGWANRRNSYPERYWSEVLDNLGINYIREYPVLKSTLGGETGGCYFLDFLLPGNVDLEIDGSQHDYATEYDNHRDELLRSAGYIVYRVRWSSPIYDRDSLLNKIEDFKSWYDKICPINSMAE